MKKWIPVLSVLLVAQLGLALAVSLGGEKYGAFQAEEPLLAFNKDAVDSIRIEDGKQSVQLEKKDAHWLLPDKKGFPASSDQIEALLTKLSGLKKGWPVATTASAAEHFKVDEKGFERRITLSSKGSQVAQLYVGTSPGFRKVHVRSAGEDAVLAVAFNTWEASAKPDDWIDKDILRLSQSDIQKVELPGVVLERDGDAFKLADLAPGEEMDSPKVQSLIGQLANLRIESLLGSEAKPEYHQDAPALEIKVSKKDGTELSYRFSKPEEGAYYVLKRSDLERWLKVAEYTVKQLKETTREKLVHQAAAPATTAPPHPETSGAESSTPMAPNTAASDQAASDQAAPETTE